MGESESQRRVQALSWVSQASSFCASAEGTVWADVVTLQRGWGKVLWGQRRALENTPKKQPWASGEPYFKSWGDFFGGVSQG